MSLVIATIVLSLLIAIWNWYQIERLKYSPHDIKEWGLRVMLWMGLLAGFSNEKYFFLNLISTPFIFWFVFDYSLNLMRGKNLLYLGDGFIDKLQKNYGGNYAWFFWKLILAGAAAQIIIKPEILQ